VVNVTPENSVAKQDELFGKDLFAREPNECCRMRKVEPLGKALRGYSAWVTGLRRVEAPTRANAPLISWDKAFGLVKINPLAAWTDEDMQNYIDANDVLVNPLVFEGYPSIGEAAAGRVCRRRNAVCTPRDVSDSHSARQCRSAIGGIGTRGRAHHPHD